MDKPISKILYSLADGKQICVEVSTPVKDLLEQADRQIRSQRRQQRRYLDIAEYIEGESEALMYQPQEDIADLLGKMETNERLYAAIGKLTEIQQRRLSMYYFDEMTTRQIAELENVNHSSVVRTISGALESLRKHLTK